MDCKRLLQQVQHELAQGTIADVVHDGTCVDPGHPGNMIYGLTITFVTSRSAALRSTRTARKAGFCGAAHVYDITAGRPHLMSTLLCLRDTGGH